MASEKPEFDLYASSYDAMHRNSIRASGEEPDYFAAYKAAYIARALEQRRHAELDVLDFGCGIGNLTPHITRELPCAKVCGVDPSTASVDMARAAYPGIARFDPINGWVIPHADSMFDVVVAACVFHHIAPADRSVWMQEIRRVLRPGGRLFVFEHNPINPLTRKAVRECPFDADAVLLRSAELRGLVHEAGLVDPAVDFIVFFPKPLAALRFLEPSLSWLPLGAQYVVVARKP